MLVLYLLRLYCKDHFSFPPTSSKTQGTWSETKTDAPQCYRALRDIAPGEALSIDYLNFPAGLAQPLKKWYLGWPNKLVPWEPKTFIFRGYFTYIYWGFRTFIFHGHLGSKGKRLGSVGYFTPIYPIYK